MAKWKNPILQLTVLALDGDPPLRQELTWKDLLPRPLRPKSVEALSPEQCYIPEVLRHMEQYHYHERASLAKSKWATLFASVYGRELSNTEAEKVLLLEQTKRSYKKQQAYDYERLLYNLEKIEKMGEGKKKEKKKESYLLKMRFEREEVRWATKRDRVGKVDKVLLPSAGYKYGWGHWDKINECYNQKKLDCSFCAYHAYLKELKAGSLIAVTASQNIKVYLVPILCGGHYELPPGSLDAQP